MSVPHESSATPLHVVIGANGQIGAQVVDNLIARGLRVRRVTRTSAPSASGEHRVGDIGELADAQRLCAGATVVYACFGGPHVTWAEQFPRMARGVIHGARRAGARLVFADNLYAYGPQNDVLTENTVNVSVGKKPKLRAEIAELFMAEHARGNLQVTIGRASDLYGPGVHAAMVNAAFVRSAFTGKTLRLPGDLHTPHTFTFVPDAARALVQLGVSSDAWGEVWHLPSAPAVSLSALVASISNLSRAEPRVSRIPSAVVRVAAVFNRDIRELVEMSFQWDRPYLVSHAKFSSRYGIEPTSLERGVRLTTEWVMQQP